jgi:CrcB protein
VTGPIRPDSSDHRAKPRGIGRTEIAVVAAGGVLGSAARYGLGQWWPSPWTVVAINVAGSLLLGLLMGVLTSTRPGRKAPHSLWRPFVGVGVLGGFTTFSTAMLQVRVQAALGHQVTAVALAVVASVGSLLAAGAGWRVASRQSV